MYKHKEFHLSPIWDSNPWSSDKKSDALPTELIGLRQQSIFDLSLMLVRRRTIKIRRNIRIGKSINVMIDRIGIALNSWYKKSDTAQLNNTGINWKKFEKW